MPRTHILKVEDSFRFTVPYAGSETVANLVRIIWSKEDRPEFYDRRLTDTNFPQSGTGSPMVTASLISFEKGVQSKIDHKALFAEHGYVAANTAELLAFRAEWPKFEWEHPIAAFGDVYRDERNTPYVPCINNGAGRGLRLRILTGGWVNFWRYLVKKAESE